MGGVFLNLFYAVENLTTAIIYKSAWWGAVSLYYFLFIAIRMYLIFSQGEKHRGRESEVCKRVGVFLFAIDVLLLTTTAFSTIFSEKHVYSGLILFGFSVYTVFSITASIMGIVRAKRSFSAVNYAARNMTLTASLASLFNLQYSWLLFLNIDEKFREFANLFVGIIIFSVMFLLAVRLIRVSHGFSRFSYNESSG